MSSFGTVILSFLALGLLLMALTFNSIAFIGEVSQPKLLNILLLVDLVYALIIAGLVALRITRLILARRSKSVGSRLHVVRTRLGSFLGHFSFLSQVDMNWDNPLYFYCLPWLRSSHLQRVQVCSNCQGERHRRTGADRATQYTGLKSCSGF